MCKKYIQNSGVATAASGGRAAGASSRAPREPDLRDHPETVGKREEERGRHRGASYDNRDRRDG